MQVLYATDGSDPALAGARLLARLPLEGDCRLTLLTVLPKVEEGEPSPEAILAPARQALQYTLASLSTEVRRGYADEQILLAAEEYAADLVVVGSRGLSGLQRRLVGSTSENVVRHARCPVLLARPLTNGLRRVVLGIDGSKGAAGAADWLKRFPLPEDCEVRLVTAVPQLELLLPFEGRPWPAEFQTYCREEGDTAKQRLEDLATSFTRIGKPCSAQVRPGDPADALLRSAEEEKADLLVVGSRGLSALHRFVLGSVSEKALHYATSSVLVVK